MCRFRVSGLLLVAMTACGRPPAPLDDAARQYLRLAVALGERDPDALDFYVGPQDAVADLRHSPPALDAIRRDARGLAAQLSSQRFATADAARIGTLTADLRAIEARVDLLTGVTRSYDDESRAFFGIAPGPDDPSALDAIRARIADLVGGRGRLVDRYAAFAARFVVPPDRLPAVMQAALDECRRRTVSQMALPPGEQAALTFVRDTPWSAFSRYLGDARSAIQINTDFRFTADQVLQLACHEGYPGHHTRNTLLAPRRDESGRPERAVQLMFSPEALESEAAAMLAADVAFSPDERIRVVRDRLLPLAGLDPAGAERHVAVERLVGDLQVVQADVARRYLDGELEFARAVAALEEQALVPHADASVKYINQYRSYVTTYTAGRQALAARLAACAGRTPADEIRWRCFKSETPLRRVETMP